MPIARQSIAPSVMSAYMLDIAEDMADAKNIAVPPSAENVAALAMPNGKRPQNLPRLFLPNGHIAPGSMMQIRPNVLSPYEIFMRVFEGLGGVEGMIMHYMSNPRQAKDRKSEFYSMFRVLLPRETNINLRAEAPGDVYLVGLDKDKDDVIDALPVPDPGPAGHQDPTPEAIARLIDQHDPQAARDDDDDVVVDPQAAPRMLRKGKG